MINDSSLKKMMQDSFAVMDKAIHFLNSHGIKV